MLNENRKKFIEKVAKSLSVDGFDSIVENTGIQIFDLNDIEIANPMLLAIIKLNGCITFPFEKIIFVNSKSDKFILAHNIGHIYLNNSSKIYTDYIKTSTTKDEMLTKLYQELLLENKNAINQIKDETSKDIKLNKDNLDILFLLLMDIKNSIKNSIDINARDKLYEILKNANLNNSSYESIKSCHEILNIIHKMILEKQNINQIEQAIGYKLFESKEESISCDYFAYFLAMPVEEFSKILKENPNISLLDLANHFGVSVDRVLIRKKLEKHRLNRLNHL